jgi:4-amino-4-deoxy-L-arabinose transferase-like glycosyltransferase
VSAHRTILARLRAVGDGWWVVVATLVFFVVTIWWITQDRRVPDFDEGNHLIDAFVVHAELASGNLTAPFTDFNSYPPLVHIVGALGIFVGGLHEAAVMLADNVVFLPLLAGGCYLAGSAANGRRAGLLAALFALGTPMIVSEMREYYVDPGEAAMVAISVGSVVATRRFERVWVSVLAGIACGIGMLSKETFPLFVGGFGVLYVLRCEWRRWRGPVVFPRHWRGLLAFLAVGAALALPWYLYHRAQLGILTSGATAGSGGAAGTGGVGVGGVAGAAGDQPARYSAANASWYLWNMLNHELLLPLTLLFLIGLCVALWRFVRHPTRADLTPELLAGGLVSWLGISYINLKDPRYSLPALVYVAVFATGWVATAPGRVRPWPAARAVAIRPWLTTLTIAIVAYNFIAVSFGVGPTLTISLPGVGPAGNSLAGARTITFVSPQGWLRGPPTIDGDLLALLRGLRRDGFQLVEFDGGSTNSAEFNNAGLTAMSIEAGIGVPPENNLPAMTDRDAFLLRRTPMPGDPPACQRLQDGTGVYAVVGDPLVAPFQELRFVCPAFKHPYYHQTEANLPENLTHVIKGTTRRELLRVMRAMRRQGIRTVEFDATSLSGAGTPYLDRVGLQILAGIAKLRTPATYAPENLGPRQAFMLRHVPAAGDPPPCERFPDGSGLYIVLGNPVKPFADYRFYCPVRTPRFYGAG